MESAVKRSVTAIIARHVMLSLDNVSVYLAGLDAPAINVIIPVINIITVIYVTGQCICLPGWFRHTCWCN